MSRHLPGREDVQCSVSQFYVHRIEQANLLESHDVPKVPTDERIDPSHGRQRDVPHVGDIPRRQNLPGVVRRDEVNHRCRNPYDRTSQNQHLLMEFPNCFRGVRHLGCRHVGQDRDQATRSKISDEAIRPRREFRVEAATQHRSVDVDPKTFHRGNSLIHGFSLIYVGFPAPVLNQIIASLFRPANATTVPRRTLLTRRRLQLMLGNVARHINKCILYHGREATRLARLVTR